MKNLLLLLVATLLLLLGLGNLLLLTPLCVKTTGVIEGWGQIVDSSTQSTDHVYEVTYGFNSKDGKHHTGSFRKKAYNTISLPSNGKLIPVRYLAFMPHINSTEGQNLKNTAIYFGFGLLLLFISFNAKPRAKA